MKKIISLFFCAFPLLALAQGDLHFAITPSLSADASKIYFEYSGDIWSVDAKGGDANRITAMSGYETNPIASPDGKWLAFGSNQNGNSDVYILSLNGGDIKQLTFNSSKDIPVSWAPDSKTLNVESGRYNEISAYKVSINGGTPVRIFNHYFNTIAHLFEMEDGSFLFNESAESYDFATRKGYKGDFNPNIKMWNPATNKYVELTDYSGKDIWATADKDGDIYFATDEKNGVYNIATIKNGEVEILTNFKNGIHTPKVSYNGDKIVFNLDYTIGVYDVKSGKIEYPEIKLAKQNATEVLNDYNVKGKITNFSVSMDGKKIAFVSRGMLFVSDIKGKAIKQLPTAKNQRVVEVQWTDDNKTILFTRTRNGWYNLFKIDASNGQGEKAVYTPDEFVNSLTANNKKTEFVFTTGDDKIELYNLKTIEKIAEAEFWTFRNFTLRFSSDDKYLAFDAMNLFESDVYIVNIATKEVTPITNSATTESSPVWSPDNKSLYILGNRYNASFPRGAAGGVNIFNITLDKYNMPFVGEQYDKLFTKEKDSLSVVEVNVNRKNIHRRWKQIQRGGSQSSLNFINSKKVNYLAYNSTHAGGRGAYVMVIDENEKDVPKAKKISGLPAWGDVSISSDRVYSLVRGKIYSVNLGDVKAREIELDYSFTQSNENEFSQMLYEVWAQLESNFYDVNFHGTPWAEKLKYYSQIEPHVQTRKDLKILVNDMLGELNASHLGFSSRGSEEDTATTLYTYETGIIFDNNSPYIVDYILEGTAADRVGVNVMKGDKLIAVNGVEVENMENRNKYFTSPQFKDELTLTFKRGKDVFDQNIHTLSQRELRSGLYSQWEDSRRNIVNEKTGDRVAYLHMRDMTGGSLNKFLIEMSNDAVYKDALILDLRFNNGGNVHHEVLNMLSQKSHFTWNYRDKKPNTHPNITPSDKPLIVLINERSLSDAEVTSNGIRNLGLAKLVGTETYRWIIFTSGVSMVDGSSCRIPAWGCYNLDGSDMELTGVKPDIYIKNTFEDRINNKDPQLDRAIAEILKELK